MMARPVETDKVRAGDLLFGLALIKDFEQRLVDGDRRDGKDRRPVAARALLMGVCAVGSSAPVLAIGPTRGCRRERTGSKSPMTVLACSYGTSSSRSVIKPGLRTEVRGVSQGDHDSLGRGEARTLDVVEDLKPPADVGLRSEEGRWMRATGSDDGLAASLIKDAVAPQCTTTGWPSGLRSKPMPPVVCSSTCCDQLWKLGIAS
jgi:hypothetical protein